MEISIFWFRRDLRLEDNVGLFHALNNNYKVLPIFIFDTNILFKLSNKSDTRVNFIYKNIKQLKQSIEEKKGSLLVLKDTPLSCFQRLIKKYQIKGVFANHDYEPYAAERDHKIKKLLKKNNITFHTFKDQVIIEKNEILKQDGKPYIKYTPYAQKWKEAINHSRLKEHRSQDLLSNFYKTPPFPIPSLIDIGFNKTHINYPTSKLSEEIIKNYEKQRNFPYLSGTSKIGIHLRFGTISIRKVVKKAIKLNRIFLNELIWREFFMMILWHFPYVIGQSFKKQYEHLNWRNNEKEFHLWCKGETGYPLVDAGMRELNETGFMHNRVRMITASFLTKHLLIDWRWGEAYFAEKLLDYELSSNNGNWQWVAGTGCDSAPYFRIFNPETQAKKFDSDSYYINKWIPDINSKSYPNPIVDHNFARERVMMEFKKILSNF